MSAPEPGWEGPVEGWVIKFLTREHWKVARTVPWEDAVQEARVVFLRVLRRYPGVEPAHFMSLFMTSWRNHFLDLANDDTRRRAEVAMPELAPGAQLDSAGDLDNDGFLRTALRQAPREVAMVLSLFLNAPQELLEAAMGPRNTRARARRTAEQQEEVAVCRLLGLPEGSAPLAATREYLSG